MRWACYIIVGVVVAADTRGQGPSSAPGTASAPAVGEKEMVQLNFPENVEVKVLVDYVTKRMGMNILYDEALVKKKLTIASPTKVPKDSLLGLLNSVLKMTGLTMVEADQPGWKKIVASQDLLTLTEKFEKDPNRIASAEATAIATQVFQLHSATTANVEQVVRPFLSKPGGNSFPIPERGVVIITDYAPNLKRICELIEMVDRPGARPTMKFVPVKHLSASELVRQVTALLREKDRLAAGAGKPSERALVLTEEPRTNQIVVTATEGAEAEAMELIQTLDVPSDAETRSYRLKYVSVQRIDQLAKEFMGAELSRSQYRSTVVPELGLLMVTAPSKVHDHIAALVKEMDVAGTVPEQSHVRFYKLLNTTAAQVLATVRALESGEKGLAALTLGQGQPAWGPEKEGFTGPNYPPARLGEELPKPPAYKPTTALATQVASVGQALGILTAKTKDAMVTADTNTNTIIVIAPPETQAIYKQLITILDRRRPQVMVEVTLVTLDTSGSFSLGVDLARAGTFLDNHYLVFSSFGLSTADTTTGALTLKPGVGFNGLLLSPDVVNGVIRALVNSGRAKVLSAPRILVNDNASATLSSVSEAPFTSVNASQTVSTTSFAGYTSAGTTLTITPHISEGEHLQMQYSVTLNSFKGEGSAGIPPPRQTNQISSEVTVPNGYAIIVGGLTRKDVSQTMAGLPVLNDIPVLGYLFGNRTTSDTQSTLFVFMRPVILRDDQFEDLKYLSDRDLKLAEMPANLPGSEPIIME